MLFALVKSSIRTRTQVLFIICTRKKTSPSEVFTEPYTCCKSLGTRSVDHGLCMNGYFTDWAGATLQKVLCNCGDHGSTLQNFRVFSPANSRPKYARGRKTRIFCKTESVHKFSKWRHTSAAADCDWIILFHFLYSIRSESSKVLE